MCYIILGFMSHHKTKPLRFSFPLLWIFLHQRLVRVIGFWTSVLAIQIPECLLYRVVMGCPVECWPPTRSIFTFCRQLLPLSLNLHTSFRIHFLLTFYQNKCKKRISVPGLTKDSNKCCGENQDTNTKVKSNKITHIESTLNRSVLWRLQMKRQSTGKTVPVHATNGTWDSRSPQIPAISILLCYRTQWFRTAKTTWCLWTFRRCST
jgi:hypothetical protein